jgi:hypothetical protein
MLRVCQREQAGRSARLTDSLSVVLFAMENINENEPIQANMPRGYILPVGRKVVEDERSRDECCVRHLDDEEVCVKVTSTK